MAKFRAGDWVIGNIHARDYSKTGEGYIGRVSSNCSDGTFYIEWEDRIFGKRTFNVAERCFDLYKREEWGFEIPREYDLVRIITLEEVKEKFKNKDVYEEIKDGIIFKRSGWKYTEKDSELFGNQKAIVTNLHMQGEFNLILLDTDYEEKLRKEGEFDSNHVFFMAEEVEILQHGYASNAEELMEKRYQKKIEIAETDEVMQEMISKVDVQAIKKILSASFNLDAKKITGVEQMLKHWAYSKKELYLLFDRNLKLTQEREMEMSSGEKRKLLDDILSQFPGEKYTLENMTYSSERINNRVDSDGIDYMSKYIPTLQKGMKFTKFAHEIFKNEKLDLELSKVYEVTKIKGFLTISIDPVDYMLMSMNNSGWSSCQSLRESASHISFGAYSSGSFSYMCDKTSIIAFRHSKNEKVDIKIGKSKVKAFNKNWRQMIFLNLKDVFFICSREYPKNTKDEATTTWVREIMEELLANKLGIENKWAKKSNDAILQFIKDAYTIRQKVLGDSILHYNDTLHGYDSTMVYRNKISKYEGKRILVGSQPKCPICGKEYLKRSGTPFCKMCKNEIRSGDDD